MRVVPLAHTQRIGLKFGAPSQTFPVPMATRRTLNSLIVVTLLLGACRDPKVEVYTIPKEKDPELPALPSAPMAGPMGMPGQGAPMASTAVPTADGPSLAWSAPAGWVSEPDRPMRKASYFVPAAGGQAELTITAFGGDVGGEVANVNRWRGLVKLAAASPEEAQSSLERWNQNGLSIALADLDNPQSGQRIVGAIVPFNGATWFFKLSGPRQVVDAAKPAFVAFLKTLKAPTP